MIQKIESHEEIGELILSELSTHARPLSARRIRSLLLRNRQSLPLDLVEEALTMQVELGRVSQPRKRVYQLVDPTNAIEVTHSSKGDVRSTIPVVEELRDPAIIDDKAHKDDLETKGDNEKTEDLSHDHRVKMTDHLMKGFKGGHSQDLKSKFAMKELNRISDLLNPYPIAPVEISDVLHAISAIGEEKFLGDLWYQLKDELEESGRSFLNTPSKSFKRTEKRLPNKNNNEKNNDVSGDLPHSQDEQAVSLLSVEDESVINRPIQSLNNGELEESIQKTDLINADVEQVQTQPSTDHNQTQSMSTEESITSKNIEAFSTNDNDLDDALNQRKDHQKSILPKIEILVQQCLTSHQGPLSLHSLHLLLSQEDQSFSTISIDELKHKLELYNHSLSAKGVRPLFYIEYGEIGLCSWGQTGRLNIIDQEIRGRLFAYHEALFHQYTKILKTFDLDGMERLLVELYLAEGAQDVEVLNRQEGAGVALLVKDGSDSSIIMYQDTGIQCSVRGIERLERSLQTLFAKGGELINLSGFSEEVMQLNSKILLVDHSTLIQRLIEARVGLSSYTIEIPLLTLKHR